MSQPEEEVQGGVQPLFKVPSLPHFMWDRLKRSREEHRKIMVLLLSNLTILKEFSELDFMWETPHVDITIKISILNPSSLPSSTWITYKAMRSASPESNCMAHSPESENRKGMQRLRLQGRNVYGGLKIRDRHQSAYSLILAEQEKGAALYQSQFAHGWSPSECWNTITVGELLLLSAGIHLKHKRCYKTFIQDQHQVRFFHVRLIFFCYDIASGTVYRLTWEKKGAIAPTQ